MYSARNKNKILQKKSFSFINYPTSKGFTMIELLIVIVVMFIVFSVGMANYRGFQQRKKLDGAAIRVKSHLRLAQEMAISGARPADCVTANLSMLSVSLIRSSSVAYNIVAQCTDGATSISPIVSSYSLVPDYNDIEISGPLSVIFNTLGKGVVSDATFTFTQSSTGDTREIVITKGGEIK